MSRHESYPEQRFEMSIRLSRTAGTLIAAAGALAIAGIGSQSDAATVNLSNGTALGVGATSYGTSSPDNNVVNAAGGYITDTTSSTMSNWLGGGTVNSTVANYSVTWYFLGNEAANQDQLSLNSGTFNFSTTSGSLGAGNHNSNLGPSTAYNSLISIGSTTGSGANAPISFSLSDISAGGPTTSDISGQTGFADIYVNPMCGVSVCGSSLSLLSGWEVSTTATNWFAIGYNDTGSSDKDYDDLVFVGEITATPLPATLPLFAGGLGFLGFLGKRDRRKNAAAIAAA
jgi:hypothetical protein